VIGETHSIWLRDAVPRLDLWVLAKTGFGAGCRIVLLRPTNIYHHETYLQNNESICARVPAPDTPEHITEKKNPKTYIPFRPRLGAY